MKRMHSNHYLNPEAAIANLRRAGCPRNIAEDSEMRPLFYVGSPLVKSGFDIVLDELGQYWYSKKSLTIVNVANGVL